MADPHNQEEPRAEAPPLSPPILVIGYGNTLRGDDGLGWIAAEQLRSQVVHSRVRILTLHQLTLDLADPISQAEHVFFLDASSGSQPGAIAISPVLPDRTAADPLHHHMPPAALLAYAEALYGPPPPAWLCTITAATYDFDTSLSPAVINTMPAFVRTVAERIARLIGTQNG
ncbi:MAG: hydrogenase maturation protease [Anaerolineae bacterium]|nr:hydrogenase maturation protease [Anaerolineae bacterium]